MGGLKVTFLLFLAISVSVRGQEDAIENEVDKLVSDVTDVVSNNVEETKEVPRTAAVIEDGTPLEETPVEVLTETEPLSVRSGRYQALNDALLDGPIDLEAVNFNTNDQQSEKQLLNPTTTLSTNSEYGKETTVLFENSNSAAVVLLTLRVTRKHHLP